MTAGKVVPLAGPLDVEPRLHKTEALDMLDAALDGLELGRWDEEITVWVAAKDAATVATIASLLRRAWSAGVATGRQERAVERLEGGGDK